MSGWMGSSGRVDVNQELRLLWNRKKSRRGACPGLGDWMDVTQDKKIVWGGTGLYEPRIEAIVEMKKVEGWGWAGSGGRDPRIEVIVKLRKKTGGG